MKKLFFVILIFFFINFSIQAEVEEKDAEEEVDNTVPIFSKISGFYETEFELTLSSEQNSEIYYTTDSSNPLNSTTVKKYSEPIKIYDRSSEPNVYADIGEDEDSPLFIGPLGGYKKPTYLIDKAIVVRAYCKNKDGNSKIISHTYFVTTGNLEKYQDFTIISLVVNPEDLFDPDMGLYVVGNGYIEAKKKLGPNTNPFGGFGNMFQLIQHCITMRQEVT